MNKVKFFYDVISAARDKKKIRGMVSMKGIKNNLEVFNNMNVMYNGFHISEYPDIKLGKMSTVFKVLKNMEIEQRQDKSYMVSMDLHRISRDIRKLIFKVIDDNCRYGKNGESEFLKKFQENENLRFDVKMVVSSKYEVESIVNKILDVSSNEEIDVNFKIE
ncbi:MAG: hypothetical protein LKE46_17050 [Clostridium sp.]|jgi:hypothetical protein|uniref:hypothetical protein n=1 Tax=Clostridium sp. TaxID=1506 RepID=UPI0025C19214|nr:hypothetical protein [Clostridium sp.]MCH3965925.1 hypothetical protein [Clostridium sp.]MCI1715986.1 hypothetical protein [Clostridium sp.]MCI1800342.1 hypothetical protein [Clostridium sp.]MCI1814163.1 hypothetical protein [Clostridium sp.]MCI1871062.1 hypothetical protein [Clostridium sp.]